MLLLALLIVVVSGLIAYVGDLIGRKMGRKRLTLLGLRPRYTAIIISVAAGMLIAILTLATAFAISKPIRDSFIVPISELRAQLAEQQRALSEAKSSLDNTQTALDSARSRVARMTRTLSGEQDKLKLTNDRLRDVRAQRQTVQLRLNQASSNLHNVEGQLRQRKDELQRSREVLLRNAALMQRNVTEIQRLEAERTHLETEQARLQEQIEKLDTFVYANFTPLALASGQEIVSGLLPVGGGAPARKALVKQLLATAEKLVRQQCRDLPAGDAPLVFLRERDKRMVKVTEADAIDAISARIAAVTGAPDAIVRLAPANNVPVNGQAFIAVDIVEIVPNTQVYAAGAEVARIEVNVGAQTTTADVLSRLVDDLLRDRVPAALRKKQMLLILRRFDPKQVGVLPATSVSMVSWTDLVSAADKARAGDGPVSVVARTPNIIRRFDPLELTLDVVPSR